MRKRLQPGEPHPNRLAFTDVRISFRVNDQVPGDMGRGRLPRVERYRTVGSLRKFIRNSVIAQRRNSFIPEQLWIHIYCALRRNNVYYSGLRVYVQQYGKERTGTNYTKALLGRNFSNVVLFDNRLGSKHDPHQEVRAWMERGAITSRAAFELLLRTDEYWRRRDTPSDDPFEWVHQPVTYEELLALAEGSTPLHYIINIKNPYAYAISVNRWRRSGLHRYQEPPGVVALHPELVRRECEAFNEAYRSYVPLIDSGRGLLARYEDLLVNALPIVGLIRDRFGLLPKHAELTDVSEVVAPSIGVSNAPFYKSYYLNQEYLSELSKPMIDVIDSAIDWDLMGYFGYSRIPGARL
jgi:hypothetical protein